MNLVTGGTGYLGRALVDLLVASSERVRVLSRRPCAGAGEVRVGDVTRAEDLDAAMDGVEVVFHLAALVDHHASPEELAAVNVGGTVAVAKAAIRAGVSRLVHCSSVSAEPGGGSTAYGRSKIEAERCLAGFESRLRILVLRPGPVYDEERSSLRKLVHFARRARVLPRPVPDIEVHLAARSDVARAMVLAQRLGVPGRPYVLCDRAPVAVSTLVRVIREETGASTFALPRAVVFPLFRVGAGIVEGASAALGVRPRLTSGDLRMWTRDRRYDVGLARADLGFEPAATEDRFREAVRRCLSAPEHAVRGEHSRG